MTSSIWVQIGLPGKKQILICHTYREWQELSQGHRNMSSNSIHDQLQRWLLFLDQWERALHSGMEVIVCGDINLNHLDWCLPSYQQSSQTKKLMPLIEKLFQQIIPLGVVQCVNVATRFMVGQPKTGIDHFYTNCPEKLSQVNTMFWGGSDHKMIFATRHAKLPNKIPRYVKKRSFKNFSSFDFCEEMSKVSWFDIYQCEDIDTAVQLFTDRFIRVLDNHAPMKIFQNRTNYSPWLSVDTKELIRQRNVAQSHAALTNNSKDWKTFRNLRNQVTSKLRVEKLNWQTKKINDSSKNPSQQWQMALRWLNWKSSSTPLQLFHQGRIINKPVEIANCQNNFFVDKVATIRANIPPPTADPLIKLKSLMKNRLSTFSLKFVHPDTVEKIIYSLRNSKSFGLDNIDTFSVKLVAKFILPALTHIINLSILSNKFPSSWKVSKVIPLYKKGDSLDPKNFRPVAMLSILSKIMEKVVFIQIIEYMESNKLVHPFHHGFRANHSTATALIEMYDSWVETIERGQYAAACFLDLSAAFDVVDHSLLLDKLRLYGFTVSSLEWMSSYLCDRSQSVYVDGFLSNVLPIESGVPQGSILGPLLYTIFTNDLPEILHNHDPPEGSIFDIKCQSCGTVCCYADDSTFSVTSTNTHDLNRKLTEKYKVISEFMSNNKLKLNSEKTHLMFFARERAWSGNIGENVVKLNTGRESIDISKSEKLLGGVVSKDLKWAEHVMFDPDSIVQKLSRGAMTCSSSRLVVLQPL